MKTQRFVYQAILFLSVIAAWMFLRPAQAEESMLSPSARATLEALKTLPESERNAILRELGSSLPVRQTSDLEKALENQSGNQNKEEDKEVHPSSPYSLHFQSTIISQKHDTLQHAPYAGPNSLQKEEDQRTSLTNTLRTFASRFDHHGRQERFRRLCQ